MPIFHSFLLMLSLLLIACGGSNSTPPSTDVPVGYEAVDAQVRQSIASSGVKDLGLVIYNAQGVKVFEKMYGNFRADQRVAIASASKLVSGLTLFRLIDAGYLSLNSSTAEVLAWQGAKGEIQLRHLLSFTSGLNPKNICIYSEVLTLAQCVAIIEQADTFALPGEEFDYGGTHLAVAGLMAQVQTGDDWNSIFQQQLAAPLGLADDLRYYAQPLDIKNTSNPLLAGGLRMSMNDYAPILKLVFNEGKLDGQEFISPELMRAQAIAPFPDAIIGDTPEATGNVRYGLTAWLECQTPATGCSKLSSPGAFGFTPWVDKTAGYYAIIGMELDSVADQGFGVELELSLQPLIESAIKK